MEFTRFAKLIRRGWAIVLIAALLGLAVGLALAASAKDSFVATSTLFVSAQNTGATADLQQGNAFTLSRVKSYADVATTAVVLEPVIRILGLEMSTTELARVITASATPDTVIITIAVTNDDPRRAAGIANAVGTSLIAAAQQIESPTKGNVSPVKITIVNRAVVPSEPSNSGGVLKVALGILIGLALGLIVALIRGSLDTRVRSESDLYGSDMPPVLAMIGALPRSARGIAVDADAPDLGAEAHRQLRTNLHVRTDELVISSILLTSSLPAEGVTTTAIGLARSIASSGQSVVLIDANLRRPAIARLLKLEEGIGLTSVLNDQVNFEDVLQYWGADNLAVITAGAPSSNPGELLGSEAAADLITELEVRFDVVVIDGPPVLAVTDSTVLARAVGGIVLVVGSGQVGRKSVGRALSALALVEAQVLGTALARVPARLLEPAARSVYN